MRKFIHVDLDAFYASVEQLDHPQLRGQPVVVGGSPQSRGVVTTASYEARKFGVRSAIPCAQAYRLCPQAHFVPPRFSRYKEISKKIRAIFHQATDLVEPLSLDEAYLDVTENHWEEPSAQRVAERLRTEIFKETGLTASAGVAPLKFLAKIASDLNKPDGLTVIPPARVDEFIQKLPVKKLWGVGPATEKKLKSMGIHFAKDFRQRELHEVMRHLGSQGRFLYDLAHGIDRRSVQPHRDMKSRGVERTFQQDIVDLEKLENILKAQAEELSETLSRIDKPGKVITLKIRYDDFHTVTRRRTLNEPTSEFSVLFNEAKKMLKEKTEAGSRPARLLGLSVSGFAGTQKKSKNQLALFDEEL